MDGDGARQGCARGAAALCPPSSRAKSRDLVVLADWPPRNEMPRQARHDDGAAPAAARILDARPSTITATGRVGSMRSRDEVEMKSRAYKRGRGSRGRSDGARNRASAWLAR